MMSNSLHNFENGMPKSRTRSMVYCALMVAVIVCFSLISIPTVWGIPFTLQTLAILLAGFVLGIKKGTVCTLAYLLLGVIGVPVFASFKGGVGIILGPTGGFLIGFIPMVISAGWSRKFKSSALRILLGCIGVLSCHILGLIWFSIISNTTVWQGFLVTSAPYLAKDIASCFFAHYISLRLVRLMK